MARTYAAILGLVGMCSVLLRALKGGGQVEGAALSALAWLIFLGVVGWVVGTVADATVSESVRRRLEEELAALDAKGLSRQSQD